MRQQFALKEVDSGEGLDALEPAHPDERDGKLAAPALRPARRHLHADVRLAPVGHVLDEVELGPQVVPERVVALEKYFQA